MSTLCVVCIRTRDDPHFKFPVHLVHPVHRKPMTFDLGGEAQCPRCCTRWRATRANTFEIVG